MASEPSDGNSSLRRGHSLIHGQLSEGVNISEYIVRVLIFQSN